MTVFYIPGGISISFSRQSVKFPDDKQLQRIGLVPDIEVKTTTKGIREGKVNCWKEQSNILKVS